MNEDLLIDIVVVGFLVFVLILVYWSGIKMFGDPWDDR